MYDNMMTSKMYESRLNSELMNFLFFQMIVQEWRAFFLAFL